MFTYNKNISLSNTAWINTDLAANDVANRVFKSYADAVTYIQANGNVSVSNQWQVFVPAGLIPVLKVYEYIRIGGVDGTIIDKLESDVTFTGYGDLFKAYISNVQINNLDIGTGNLIAIYNSVINGSTEQSSLVYALLSNCTVTGGDFTNHYFVKLDNTNFTALSSDIILDKGSTGQTIYFNNCLFNKLDNNITINCNATFKNCPEVEFTTINGDVECYNSNRITGTNIIGDIYASNCPDIKTEINGSSDSYLFSCGEIYNLVVNKSAGNFNIFDTVIKDITITSSYNVNFQNCVKSGTVTNNGGATVTWSGNYYDNTTSGLTATNVNAAIDELKALIDAL